MITCAGKWSESAFGLDSADDASDLEQRVGATLGVDHVRAQAARLIVPVREDALVGPAAGQCTSVAADHLPTGPKRVRRQEETASFSVGRQPDRPDDPPRGVVTLARDQEVANLAFSVELVEQCCGLGRCERRRVSPCNSCALALVIIHMGQCMSPGKIAQRSKAHSSSSLRTRSFNVTCERTLIGVSPRDCVELASPRPGSATT